jgi:hypothetical protein
VTNGAGTPPPEAAEAPALGLVDLLEGIAAEPETKDEPEPEPEPEAKPEKVNGKKLGAKKAEAKPAVETEKVEEQKSDPENALEIDEAIFSDDALATPEGVARAAEVAKAAADAVKKRNRVLDHYDMRIKRKDAKSKAEVAADRAKLDGERAAWEQGERAQLRAAANQVIPDLQILNPRSGASAIERFNALGRLVQMDGRQFYEDVSLGIAADGKVPGPTRSEQALQAELQQIRAQLEQKMRGDTDAQTQAQVHQLKQGIAGQLAEISTLAQDAEAYPAIAARVADADDDGETLGEVVEWVKGLMVKAHAAGKPLDKATAIGRVEARLARLNGGAPRPATEVAESGSSPKPGGPARGAGKGTTVLPTSADRSTGHVREPRTEAERDAENLRDPAFRAALPFLR